jgi:topoisomerase-4 subunit A
MERSFADVIIKGRGSKGNLLTKKPVHRITLKSQGHSTLGGRKVWFDPDVNRLNYDEHGRLLGEFFDEDQILVVLKNGDFYLTNFDANNHYETDILRIEKYDSGKVWTAALFDADNQGYPYLKRFLMEATKRKQNFLGENATSKLILLSDQVYPLIRVTYGGADEVRGSEDIDAEQFIAVKGFKAKGKRISTWQIESIVELETVRFPEVPEEPETPEAPEPPEAPEAPEENLDPDAGKSQQQIVDEMTGQLSFDF